MVWFFSKNDLYLCSEPLKIDLCRQANSPLYVVSSWMVHCPREHRLLHEFDNKLGSDYLGEGT